VDGGALTAPEAIGQLLSGTDQLRNNRRLQAAMRSNRSPAVKQLRDFDFTFQPSLRREQIESLHELGFVERRENVIFLERAGRRQNAGIHSSRAASLLPPPRVADVSTTGRSPT
jgi:hypothetical protein